MSKNFNLATNQTLTRPDPAAPMVVGVPSVLFSGEIPSAGSDQTYNSCRVFVKYHSFDPDTDNPANHPYRFDILAVLEQQQENLSWEEIGRQNTPISRVTTGKEREIYVSPQSLSTEEGVDIEIVGFNNAHQRRKSMWQDETSGVLRVRIIAMQDLANNDTPTSIANPFVSTTLTISGTRFNA